MTFKKKKRSQERGTGKHHRSQKLATDMDAGSDHGFGVGTRSALIRYLAGHSGQAHAQDRTTRPTQNKQQNRDTPGMSRSRKYAAERTSHAPSGQTAAKSDACSTPSTDVTEAAYKAPTSQDSEWKKCNSTRHARSFKT